MQEELDSSNMSAVERASFLAGLQIHGGECLLTPSLLNLLLMETPGRLSVVHTACCHTQNLFVPLMVQDFPGIGSSGLFPPLASFICSSQRTGPSSRTTTALNELWDLAGSGGPRPAARPEPELPPKVASSGHLTWEQIDGPSYLAQWPCSSTSPQVVQLPNEHRVQLRPMQEVCDVCLEALDGAVDEQCPEEPGQDTTKSMP